MNDIRFDAVLDEIPTMMILNYLLRKRPQVISVNMASQTSMNGVLPAADRQEITLVPQVQPVSQEHYPGPALAPDSDAPEEAIKAMESTVTVPFPKKAVAPPALDMDDVLAKSKTLELKPHAAPLAQVPFPKKEAPIVPTQMPSPFKQDTPVVANETNPAPTQNNARAMIQEAMPLVQGLNIGDVTHIIDQDGRFDSNPTVRKSQSYQLLGMNLGNNDNSHDVYLRSAAAYIVATRPELKQQLTLPDPPEPAV